MGFVHSFVFYLLPHHLISWISWHLARVRWSPLKGLFIRMYTGLHPLNMAEAVESDSHAYETLNALFTRALKPGTRPIDAADDAIACPADGRISQIGRIRNGRIIQAKGQDYSLLELLGGNIDQAAPFVEGHFVTVYLSPVDYHRVHCPVSGKLQHTTYVPGRLFSVAPATVNNIPRLFARNERLVSQFESEFGPVCVIMVGAINVSAIDMVWQKAVTPPSRSHIVDKDYRDQNIELGKGEEMGRFNLGSTVILLLGEKMQWLDDLAPGVKVNMGQTLGHYTSQV